jgi:CDP-diacylglycerol--glycerol-3-phosphate 3-phosphatidyltransferase
MVRDIHFSYFMTLLLVAVVSLYARRAFRNGRARHARADADGGSVLLGKPTMEMAYWMLEPLVSFLANLGITPNMVTVASLVPALLAAVAAGVGWFGLACVLATAGSFCDLLDGLLARRLGVASDSGEVIDAAVDRYSEFLFLMGLGVYYRTHWMMLVLVFAALGGSFMFSYSTAKAEAMDVEPTRGAMRRAERAVYLLFGAGLTAFSRVLFADTPSHALRELPMVVAVALVAVVTNVSTVQRFVALSRALRARTAPPPTSAGIIAQPEPPASQI